MVLRRLVGAEGGGGGSADCGAAVRRLPGASGRRGSGQRAGAVNNGGPLVRRDSCTDFVGGHWGMPASLRHWAGGGEFAASNGERADFSSAAAVHCRPSCIGAPQHPRSRRPASMSHRPSKGFSLTVSWLHSRLPSTSTGSSGVRQVDCRCSCRSGPRIVRPGAPVGQRRSSSASCPLIANSQCT